MASNSTYLNNSWNPWAVDGAGGSDDTTAPSLPGEAWSWLAKNQSGPEGTKIIADWENQQLVGKGGAVKILGWKDGVLKAVSQTEFMQGIMTAKPAQVKKYQQILKQAGYLPNNYVANGNPMDPQGQFQAAMLRAAGQVSLQNFIRYNDLTASGKKGEPYQFDNQLKTLIGANAGQQVNTNTSVMNFSEGETRALLEDFYAEALGRRPSDDEVAKFQKRINAKAKNNASVSTTIYTSGGSTTTDKEGFTQADAQLMARKSAESKPGASGFIASTKYMDAFLGALRGKASQI